MLTELFGGENRGMVLLLSGGVGLLVAVMMCAESLAGPNASPGKRAWVHWMPIAIAGVVAAALGRSEMGLGIAYGTSVAALSAVAGLVGLGGPMDHIPSRAIRLWAFLPVPAVLAFVIGFRGEAGWFEAVLLIVQGGLVWVLCSRDDPEESMGEAPMPRKGRGAVLMGVEMLAGAGIAAVAAWAAVRGAEGLVERDTRYSTNTIAAIFLSVALVMPMTGTGTQLASVGRAWEALSSQVMLVLLNLCVLAPVVIVIGALVSRAGGGSWSIVFPRTIWRIDALAGVMLAMVFAAMAAGRVRLDRKLSVGLLVGYGLYMLCTFIADAFA